MFSVFEKVIENAVEIEVHKRSNYKVDSTLEKMYILISAFETERKIVPVKLEIKEFNNKDNSLYVAIALDEIDSGKIKTAGVLKQVTTENGVAQNFRPAEISVAQLMRNVNHKIRIFTFKNR